MLIDRILALGDNVNIVLSPEMAESLQIPRSVRVSEVRKAVNALEAIEEVEDTMDYEAEDETQF